jgi:lanosterol synthase
MLTLMEGPADFAPAVERAASALRSLQRDDGDWDSPMMSGVFFRTALLDYRLYRRFFPVWALAMRELQVRDEAPLGAPSVSAAY